MVMSVLGMALAAGADYEPAIPLANVAGGLEVEKIGVATVTRDEILRDLLHGSQPRSAIEQGPALEALLQELDYRRRLGPASGFHQRLLRRAARRARAILARGSGPSRMLVVGLNSDASVRCAQRPEPAGASRCAARSPVLAGVASGRFRHRLRRGDARCG